MLDRLSAGPLVKGVLAGLRRRAATGTEGPDHPARIILFGVPLLVAGLLLVSKTIIASAEVALAAAALLIGALLAGFAQVASWRERILARARRVDGPRIRALNEAGALILLSIHVSVLAAVLIFALALVEVGETGTVAQWAAICLSALGAACLAYVAMSLIYVANLLWDGFMNEQSDSEREAVPDL